MLDINTEIDTLRLAINKQLDPEIRAELGQFFTPGNVGMFMASLFKDIKGEVSLLEPGVGIGSLVGSFVQEAAKRKQLDNLIIESFDLETGIKPVLEKTINFCNKVAATEGFKIEHQFHRKDFIISAVSEIHKNMDKRFSHVIMNPPYKKINSDGNHRLALRTVGIEAVNLYAAFFALSVEMLKDGGELVAIIPRSFCNGTYYQPFREFLLKSGSIKHIHIFDSRSKAFASDEVLQENIIIHFIKGLTSQNVTITSSPDANFHIDKDSDTIVTTDMTTREISFDKLVQPKDKQFFIHIAATSREQDIINRLSCFTTSLEDLGIKVSTGPVVDFRHQDDWIKQPEPGAAPLLYPHHFTGSFSWPKETKKPNAIRHSPQTNSFLWQNKGHFVVVKRFSSKEEKHRIMAFVYGSDLPGELIGFDNKLNVFHTNKIGLSKDLAKGLYIYLNSSLLDKYYRQFGGHTQVNASDLKSLHYPDKETLERIGKKVIDLELSQPKIDLLLDQEIENTEKEITKNPLMAHGKIEEVLGILKQLGMPRQQLNERSALTLLALLAIQPDGLWEEAERPMIGVTPIMDWIASIYGKAYAPNTRETFRRQTLHQFIDSGIALYNPDDPKRAVNSPKACYQIAPELHNVLISYGKKQWDENLKLYMGQRETLIKRYAMARDMEQIPLIIDEETTIKLSAGEHSELIKAIIIEFGPRFAPGAEVIYVGDTGAKNGYFKTERLKELGVEVDNHGKMPDVVLYWKEKNWLFLIESVTSHGPVDGKRHGELKTLFSTSSAGLVYVTAFPSRSRLKEYLDVMSWETEIWFADSPTHLMHLNGDRFLGPHTS
ncbi:adenine-specific DNA-methyltransferase [Pedobacter cryoconitis]|uniref:site-specific DNA-methyltransferase (adenine-specific) n=1 Tax=Pedobacter cryoconitis TaxID=188932 RepID=A0A7W8YPZ0_9SPHI|nr:BsuBI/PstI family type II restriction endonuclease [Pedobacter cryoconitis]MBB5619547.1 adenine-specific DNA-methyltransferase [Pedobacter cryoconitis]